MNEMNFFSLDIDEKLQSEAGWLRDLLERIKPTGTIYNPVPKTR